MSFVESDPTATQFAPVESKAIDFMSPVVISPRQFNQVIPSEEYFKFVEPSDT